MKTLLACVAAMLLAGCAIDPASSTEPVEDKEYRTGSNLPSRTRDGVYNRTPEEYERARAATIGNTGRPRAN